MNPFQHRETPVALVVEDDSKISYLLQFMLSRSGFTVHVAGDGQQASDMISSMEQPDIVLLDVMLPYVDGFQLLAQLRAKTEWKDVPVVMLTAKSQECEVARALEAGANDYIIKPFRPNELLARVRRFLKVAA